MFLFKHRITAQKLTLPLVVGTKLIEHCQALHHSSTSCWYTKSLSMVKCRVLRMTMETKFCTLHSFGLCRFQWGIQRPQTRSNSCHGEDAGESPPISEQVEEQTSTSKATSHLSGDYSRSGLPSPADTTPRTPRPQ